MEQLIEQIKEYLKVQFCIEYTGKLTLEKEILEDDVMYYTLSWPLNSDDPNGAMQIVGQFADDASFLIYVKKEIKSKRFFLFKNYRVIKIT